MDIRSYFKHPQADVERSSAETDNAVVLSDFTEEFTELKTVAIKHLVQFGSTYVCESAFSIMNVIKTDLRSRLSDDNLEMALRIALTTYKPDYHALLSSMNNLQLTH